MHAKERITLETNAVSIVATLMWYGSDQNLVWSSKIIASLANLPLESTTAALSWLQSRSLVNAYKCEYIVTDAGREYYEAAKKNPLGMVKGSDVFAFKLECLTGLMEHRSKMSKLRISEQSAITRGVLPTTKPEPERHITPEDVMLDYENRQRQLKRTARQLGLTEEQVTEYWASERIRICGGGGEHHLGLFDANEEVCRKCLEKRGRK